MIQIPEEEFFERVADGARLSSEAVGAPSKLKAQIYSALMLREAATGPLASFTPDQGRRRPLMRLRRAGANCARGRTGEIVEHLPRVPRARTSRESGQGAHLLAELPLRKIPRALIRSIRSFSQTQTDFGNS